jgi:hypothetical protein
MQILLNMICLVLVSYTCLIVRSEGSSSTRLTVPIAVQQVMLSK